MTYLPYVGHFSTPHSKRSAGLFYTITGSLALVAYGTTTFLENDYSKQANLESNVSRRDDLSKIADQFRTFRNASLITLGAIGVSSVIHRIFQVSNDRRGNSQGPLPFQVKIVSISDLGANIGFKIAF